MFELRREIFHILSGILFILIILFFPVPYGQLFLFIVLIFGGFVSFLSTRFHVPVVSRFLEIFERKQNYKIPGKGVIFFFIGSLLSLQLFPRDIALASIIILTFADPVSHFIGCNFGKTCLISRRKYIEGTIFGILVGTLLAGFFVFLFIAFIGAFIAMFLESAEIAMSGRNVDDNLLIPIVAGTVMYIVSLRFF